ncbi:Cold shock protein [Portunus trituberculatus]|uniref:Cold shock protein n=1 Tax=Portunus trituberculatus TaxID=210409 RepID=A0A5B7FT84_PORTR|nr:Cold shock protein [Portunus trituberculatus]
MAAQRSSEMSGGSRGSRSAVNAFVKRALTHSSTWKATNAELRRVSQLLTSNGYPQKDIDDVIRRMDAFMSENKLKTKEPGITLYYKDTICTVYKDEKAMKKIICSNSSQLELNSTHLNSDSRNSQLTERTSPDYHGNVKWYNAKAGYGFITDQRTGRDVFVHATGFSRPLKENLPREEDKVLLKFGEGVKGPEAKDVAWDGSPSRQPIKKTRLPHKTEVKDVQTKVWGCIYTAKAISGVDHRRLQDLLSLLLQHNGLPAIYILRTAFDVPHRSMQRTTRRVPPANHRTEAIDVDQRRQNRTKVKVERDEPKAEEEAEDEEEDEEVDEEYDDEDDDMEYDDEDEVQECVHVIKKTRTTDTPQPTSRTRETRSPPAIVKKTTHSLTADRGKAAGTSKKEIREALAKWEEIKIANPLVKLLPIKIKIDEDLVLLSQQEYEGWITVRRRQHGSNSRTSPNRTLEPVPSTMDKQETSKDRKRQRAKK